MSAAPALTAVTTSDVVSGFAAIARLRRANMAASQPAAKLTDRHAAAGVEFEPRPDGALT
eukprot:1333905-Prymnesium_polylepis.2